MGSAEVAGSRGRLGAASSVCQLPRYCSGLKPSRFVAVLKSSFRTMFQKTKVPIRYSILWMMLRLITFIENYFDYFDLEN